MSATAGVETRWFGRAVDSRVVFLLGLLLAGSGLVSPPVALVGGAAFGFAVEHPLRAESARLARLLLQASVVLLGFGMNLAEVVHAGRAGFAYTAVSITVSLGLGLMLGKGLKVAGKASFLIAAGTAICGGSAIAALAPITQAGEEEISVGMGTVFLLNSVALLLFPVLGHAMKMSQNQFGLWAALAIHDTSSVVGAGTAYGPQALAVGTTVKLARALWIVPLSLVTAAWMRRGRASGNGAKVKMPWFIVMFCAAAAMSTYLPAMQAVSGSLTRLGKAGLTATLFLIGTSLSKRTLERVGVRPLAQGVVLWAIVATASAAAICAGWIGIA
jgi:uncharacterized integral membrane protein (TIGR00698 family)